MAMQSPYQAALANVGGPAPAPGGPSPGAGPSPGSIIANALLRSPQGAPPPTGIGAMNTGGGVPPTPRESVSEAIAGLGKVRQAFPAAQDQVDAMIGALRAMLTPPKPTGGPAPAPSPAPPTGAV